MSTQKILDSNWSEYDDRKKRNGSDHNHFACTEDWEVDYLVKKITQHYLNISEASIRSAIKACCKDLRVPHPRKNFVACVMKGLGLD